MEPDRDAPCTDILLDLACYETLRGSLSPETMHLFARHLRRCPSCRRKVLDFRAMLRAGTAFPAFNQRLH